MSDNTLSPGFIAKEAARLIERPGFLGNQSLTPAGQAFQSAISAASSLSGIIDTIRNNDKKTQTKSISSSELSRAFDLPWSDEVVTEITKVANKIAQLSNVRVEDAEDFLYILITTDSHEVMTKFATATDIAELADASIMMKPMEILAIPGIEKVAYLADAISAILKAYKKYFQDDNYDNRIKNTENFNMDDITKALEAGLGIASAIFSKENGGGGAGPINAGSPGSILGPLLSLLTRGKEIPMGVQANNPMLQPRTILNMMMFGASPNSTHQFDKASIFPKPIAVFGDVMSGAGDASFSAKNKGSMNAPQSLQNIVTKSASNAGLKLDVSASDIANEMGAITLSNSAVPDNADQFATVDPNAQKGQKQLKKDEEESNLKDQIGSYAQTPKTAPKPPNIMENVAKGLGEMVSGALGAKLGDMVEMSKADNAVPILGAMSNALNSLQDFIPQVNSEMREALSTVTSTMDGIGNLFSTMTNLQNALKQGMNPTTLASALVSGAFGSVIKPPSLFPTSVFQGGWTHMSSVNQALAKDNRFYQQVLYILNNLG